MTEEKINELSISEEDDVVDPWNVAGKSQTGIDYDKLISEYLKHFHSLSLKSSVNRPQLHGAPISVWS